MTCSFPALFKIAKALSEAALIVFSFCTIGRPVVDSIIIYLPVLY